jgi:hypothetical protein
LRPLVRRQSLPLSDARWRGDLQRLVETLERIPGLERLPTPAPVPSPAPAPTSKKALFTGIALGVGGLLGVSLLVADPPAPSPAPASEQAAVPALAPAPAPAPMPAPTAPAQALMPPDQLQALAQRVLQGRWQAENDPTVFIELQQIGDRVSVQFQANGIAVGQGQGQFDGRQLVLQVQAELFGQALMQGRCTLQWVAAQQRLIGPCAWPSGTEATVWGKRA